MIISHLIPKLGVLVFVRELSALFTSLFVLKYFLRVRFSRESKYFTNDEPEFTVISWPIAFKRSFIQLFLIA